MAGMMQAKKALLLAVDLLLISVRLVYGCIDLLIHHTSYLPLKLYWPASIRQSCHAGRYNPKFGICSLTIPLAIFWFNLQFHGLQELVGGKAFTPARAESVQNVLLHLASRHAYMDVRLHFDLLEGRKRLLKSARLALQGVLSSIATPESTVRSKDLSRLRVSSSSGQLGALGANREGASTAAHLTAWRNRRGFPLDITAFHGAELLTSKVTTLPAGGHTQSHAP